MYVRLCRMFITIQTPIAQYPNLHRNRLLQLDHDVRDLNILLILVLRGNLEDDVLLMLWDWLLTDMLNKLAHPRQSQYMRKIGKEEYLRQAHAVFQLRSGVEGRIK
jgi:hypothetical protein